MNFENTVTVELSPGMEILQYGDGFGFGTDAVLLSEFIKPPHKNAFGVEFGTGTGAIPILLSQRCSFGSVTAFEIQEEYALLAEENIRRTGLSDKISVLCADLKKARELIPREADFLFTNPPYMKADSGRLNPDKKKLIARHEIHCTIDDVCQSAYRVLKSGGDFFAVYRTDRLCDLLCAMRKARIEPKELVTVDTKNDRLPTLCLVRGKKDGKSSMTLHTALFEKNLNF